jgi:hypothetical protein
VHSLLSHLGDPNARSRGGRASSAAPPGPARARGDGGGRLEQGGLDEARRRAALAGKGGTHQHSDLHTERDGQKRCDT